MSSRITIDQTSRNVICSVVFVDLVGYSKKSVAEQLAIKDRFTALLAEALKDISVNDRIVLDTGDGAAMSFLGDPEDALFVGMSLRDALKGPGRAPGAEPGPEDGSIRIGINLGPVRLVKDINGHPNIVGDGINVAQRIMSFAEPGQILVSRSYFDVVSCLSDEYAKLFKYEGSRTDKHVREHEVYVVGVSESAFKQAKTGLESRAAQTHPGLRAQPEAGAQPALRDKAKVWVETAQRTALEFARDRRKVTIAGAALGAVVLLLAVLLAVRKPAAPPIQTAAAPAAAAPAPAAAPPAEPAAKPEAAPGAAAREAAGAAPQKAPRSAVAAAKPEAKKAAAAKPEAPPGQIDLAIVPWGEVFVNGRSRGVSPPIKHLKLAPGTYSIEVRNTTFAPHQVVVQVKPGEEVTIRHVFK
jgi:class 3 adenylate cyclase